MPKKPIKTEEERLYDEAAELGLLDPITFRRAELARTAKFKFVKSLEHLEAACDRNSTRVVVKVDGFSVDNTGDWVNVCRALARCLFKEAKYWEFHYTRLLAMDTSTKAQMQRVYEYYHHFAGDADE